MAITDHIEIKGDEVTFIASNGNRLRLDFSEALRINQLLVAWDARNPRPDVPYREYKVGGKLAARPDYDNEIFKSLNDERETRRMNYMGEVSITFGVAVDEKEFKKFTPDPELVVEGTEREKKYLFVMEQIGYNLDDFIALSEAIASYTELTNGGIEEAEKK